MQNELDMRTMNPLQSDEGAMSIATKIGKFNQKFLVGWSDLDGNSHMGNTSYLGHASNTRMLFFAVHGFSLARFASEKFGPVMMRDELVYHKELRLMDEFAVDFELVGLSGDGVQFRVRNTFRNAANAVAAAVTSDGVWFDLERRRPRTPPEELDNLMRALQRSKDFAEIPSKISGETT
jgi:acyl-CoA thioester hydrolase